MSELEIKLHVEPGRRGGLLDAPGRRKIRRSTLSAIYFDTSDLLLARHGFTLRLRNEDGRWVQTLERSQHRAAERMEHEVSVETSDAVVPTLDLERHRPSQAGRHLRALLRRAKHPRLAESCRTEVTRLRRLLNAHGAEVEWALDEGRVSAAGRSRPICELELEFRRGDPAGLFALAHDWVALHGLWIDPVSKSGRGTLLIEDRPFSPATKASPAPLDSQQASTLGGQAMLRRQVASCLEQILPNAAEIAWGSPDTGHVHQLRVGLRRLRSVARGMKRFATTLPDEWEPAVMPVFAALGEARDQHALSASIAPALQRAGAPVVDAPSSPAPAQALQDLVRGMAFQGALIRLLGFAQASSPDIDGAQDGSGLEYLTRRLRKLAHQVTRGARRFEELPFSDQHRVRKRLKRLRYLAEFAAPAFDSRDVKDWMKRVSRAQDELGRHIDVVRAGERFAAMAPSDPGAWFAVGWLRAQQERSARASRKSLEHLRRSTGFWVRTDA